jgi:hypothetical protein
MPMVNLSTAVAITGRSPMTLRAAIRSGELRCTEGRWHGGRKGEPGRVVWIDTEDLRAWHEAHGGKGRWNAGAIPADTVEALRAEVERLRALLAQQAPRAVIAPLAPVAPRPPAPTVPRRSRAPAPEGNLPDGLVSLREEGRRHGGGDRSYNAWVHNAALGVVSGKWPGATPRAHPVTKALTPQGRRRFHEWYGGWDGAHLPAAWWTSRPDVCELCRAHAPTATSTGASHISGAPQSV